MNEKKLEYLSTEKLTPYARNSRTHNQNQINQIAASIQEFGFTNPVLIDDDNGIIAGHGRVLAANQLNLKKIPCLRLIGLTDQQKRAYVIADNQIALNAGWDMDILKDELSFLSDHDFDIDLLGFDEKFIDFLNRYENSKKNNVEKNDDFKNYIAITKFGDVWKLGRHKLICGDSVNKNHLNLLLNNFDWDGCFFDPPYELENLYSEIPQSMPGKKLFVMWDFKRFAIASFHAIKKGWNPCYEMVWDCVQSWYTPNRPLQRHKSIGIFGDDPFFDTDKSILFDGKNRGEKRIVKNSRGYSEYSPLFESKHISTVEQFPNTAQNDEHGHGKPIKWIESILLGSGCKKIIDLFCGSGAVLIACELNDLICYAVEIDPKNCDMIIKRWQDITGETAILEKNYQTFDELVSFNKMAMHK